MRHNGSPAGLSRRADPADLPEQMDDACTYEQFRDCVRDLAAMNRWTRAYRPTLQFLEQVASRQHPTHPLKIVDVGSGGGDALRKIALWAQRRGLVVELTGIDLNPYATRAAMEFSAKEQGFDAIRWVTGNAWEHQAVQHCDVVISSLLTHHLRDDEIITFLRWMEAHATRGWFIYDLLRSQTASRWFGLWARCMRWHPFVQHDGPVSFQRAFLPEDWHSLLTQARVSREAVELLQPGPGRLCLARLR